MISGSEELIKEVSMQTVKVTQLEHQIESLSLAEQIRMLEKLVQNLKQIVTPTAHVANSTALKSSAITKQLNKIYVEVDSALDHPFIHAQSATLARDDWR